MRSPRTLHGRLTLAYASALVVALIAFALLAIAVLDRAQRAALDTQLATTAHAGLAVASEGSAMDTIDRAQFVTIVGAKAQGALLDPDGRTIVSSASVVPAQIRRVALRGDQGRHMTVRVNGDLLRVYAAPFVLGGRPAGYVAVWRDAESIEALDRSVALAFAIAIPALVAIAVAFGGAIARRGLAPLDHMIGVASEIEGHDLSRRLALPPSDDELGRLAATFDRMLDRLQRAFARERRFTSDASHELRAPLSVIRAEADLALRKDRSSEDYRRALQAIAAEADALEALTRDLLAAARADGPLPTGSASVDLGAAAHRAVDRMQVLAEDRAIRITRDLRAQQIVAVDGETLERAIVTVLHNAIKYAPHGGMVTVCSATADGVAELCITDNGPGFSDEALARAFDRFWRDNEARNREGTGLGLAIAKAIVERSGGEIGIANAPGGGAVVRMRFPTTPPRAAS